MMIIIDFIFSQNTKNRNLRNGKILKISEMSNRIAQQSSLTTFHLPTPPKSERRQHK